MQALDIYKIIHCLCIFWTARHYPFQDIPSTSVLELVPSAVEMSQFAPPGLGQRTAGQA